MSSQSQVQQQTAGWLRRIGFAKVQRAITEEEYRLLSVRELMLRKFLRNRMATWCGLLLVFVYLTTLFAGFFAPYSARESDSSLTFSPPMIVRFHDPETGVFYLQPFFYPLRGRRDPQTFQLEYEEDRSARIPIDLFRAR